MHTKKGFAAGFALGALAASFGALALYKKRGHMKRLRWRFAAKREIYRRLRAAKRLTRPFYEDAVDDVLARYRAAGDIGREEIAAFSAELKDAYETVRARLAEAVGEAEDASAGEDDEEDE
ncbi:MAG: hypothetical protein KGI78_04420 [Patescibacteria group bacterium]|nr:hypothetical protein [Patescibacteria group bacterium]MDE1945346.1 hypothetical protein [Patescibacteria group bacterium]MDE2058055.1 hypothetical protein [Patescibacteria group bacterium]